MTIKDELREQFDFFKRQPFENKKEYKKRVTARGQELLDRKNCTLEEAVTFRALYNCRAKVFTFGDSIIGDLSSEEYALRKGNAKDYEKFADLCFFQHLDEDEFRRQKRELYDVAIKTLFSHPYYFSADLDWDLYGWRYDDELLEDEKLEGLYGGDVKGKDGKVKVKGVTLKGRVFGNKK